jgi:GTP-binding protein EngB required for normal cell division
MQSRDPDPNVAFGLKGQLLASLLQRVGRLYMIDVSGFAFASTPERRATTALGRMTWHFMPG